MKRNKNLRLFTIIVSVLVLLSALSGCQTGKKFESPEAMISEMTGTYSGIAKHSDERIVIDGSNVIQFNIDEIFPEITETDFFWENFPNENWETFDITALLSKPYITITTQPISANIEESTISGLWINKKGVLFISEDHSFEKTSSDPAYPTAEMQEKFEAYYTYLQEYEKSSIITEAESNFSEKQDTLNSVAYSAATSTSSSKKSTASAETIANCAFESLMDHIKYPRTAKMEGFSTNPQYDSYGRVCTLITATMQNGFGNYITKDLYVVLQSCSSSGSYTYTSGGMHYTDEEDYLQYLLVANSWDRDPSTDSTKETPYNEAIALITTKDYQLAIDKLDALGDYKSSKELKDACINFTAAEKYQRAIDLFAEGKYAEAKEVLTSLLKEHSGGYLRAQRVIALCDAAIGNTSDNESTSQPSETTPAPPVAGLFGKLDYNKVWMADYTLQSWSYTLHLAFDANGNCYFGVGCPELLDAGSGTYLIEEDTTLKLTMTVGGKQKEYIYQFDPDNNTLMTVSKEGLLGEYGDTLALREDSVNDVAKVKSWSNMSSGSVGDDEESGPAYSGSSGSSGGNTSSGNSSSGGNTSSGSSSSGGNTSSGNSSSGGNTSSGNSSSGGNTSSGNSNNSSGNTSSGNNTPSYCDHNYVSTCTTPETCTKCGATRNNYSDHDFQFVACGVNYACTQCGEKLVGSIGKHNWERIKEDVYHEEVGHYGDVQLSKKVQKYRCPMCGYNQPTYSTLDAYYAHFDSAHSASSISQILRDRYELVEEREYYYETQWIVDKEAYTETIIKCYKCTLCGKEQDLPD